MRVFQSAEDEWGCRYIGSIKAAETTARKRFYNIHANTHRCVFIVWHSVVKQHVTLHTTEIMTVYTASSGMFLDIKRVNWGDLAAGIHAVRTCFCFLFYPLGYNYPSQFIIFFLSVSLFFSFCMAHPHRFSEMLNLAASFFASAPEASEQEAEDESKTLLGNAHIQ